MNAQSTSLSSYKFCSIACIMYTCWCIHGLVCSTDRRNGGQLLPYPMPVNCDEPMWKEYTACHQEMGSRWLLFTVKGDHELGSNSKFQFLSSLKLCTVSPYAVSPEWSYGFVDGLFFLWCSPLDLFFLPPLRMRVPPTVLYHSVKSCAAFSQLYHFQK